jgi:transcriptional regulator with XRE-family HTH domain
VCYKLKIKEYRRLNNITQRQLASRIGISQNYLSELENGKYDISLNLLCKIGEVLEESPKNLFECTLKRYKK